jgi:hypothetical protein
LNSCSIDKRADTVCSDPNFWIEYNRVNFSIEPKEYPNQVYIDYDLDKMILKMDTKRYSGKDVAVLTYKLIRAYYYDLHEYVKVESIKNLYTDVMIQHAISVGIKTQVIMSNPDPDIGITTISNLPFIPKRTVIDVEPFIEKAHINETDIELFKTSEYEGIYFLGEPFVEVNYNFPLIDIKQWLPADGGADLLNSPFGRSLWEFMKWLIKQPTKYYDVPNDSSIIVNFNASFYNINLVDVNGEFFTPNLYTVVAEYRNVLIKMATGKSGWSNDKPLNPKEKQLYDLLISDERLDTDPDIDSLFTEYTITPT